MRARADATPAITKNPCQICDAFAANNTSQTPQGSSAAKLLTCLCCEVLQQVVSICKCFGYLCTFSLHKWTNWRPYFFKSCVFSPRLFSEVAPRWALLAAVAVTDGKDDNSSGKQWTNCRLQRRRLITLGTHLRRLRHTSNRALDALMHLKYCMIKEVRNSDYVLYLESPW